MINSTLKYLLTALLLSILQALTVPAVLVGQPVLTPKNMALGGGGSTYLNDYSANFYNPANLFIKDRKGSVDIGFMISGAGFSPVQNFTNPERQGRNFLDYFNRYTPGTYDTGIREKEQITADNYTENRLVSAHRAEMETIWFGVRKINKNNAFSLALRTRSASSFEAGKNWYTNAADNTYNRTLNHRFQTLHELSFGYSEAFAFLNGLSSVPQNIIVGIAPKLVLGGAYQAAEWQNTYHYTEGGAAINNRQRFSFDAAGHFSDAVHAYLSGRDVQAAIAGNISPFGEQLFEINGYGAGLDIGVTYLLNLEENAGFLNNGKEVLKSVRLSLSVTDLGLVAYQDKGISYHPSADTLAAPDFPATASEVFTGAPGQFLVFADEYADSNPFFAHPAESKSFSVLLPAMLHSGILFDFNRFKIAGDISLGVNNTAFSSKSLAAAFGAEIRVLQNVPLRGGTRFTAGRPGIVSLGTALETRYWDFSVAAQTELGAHFKAGALSSAAVAALQFHL